MESGCLQEPLTPTQGEVTTKGSEAVPFVPGKVLPGLGVPKPGEARLWARVRLSWLKNKNKKKKEVRSRKIARAPTTCLGQFYYPGKKKKPGLEPNKGGYKGQKKL